MFSGIGISIKTTCFYKVVQRHFSGEAANVYITLWQIYSGYYTRNVTSKVQISYKIWQNILACFFSWTQCISLICMCQPCWVLRKQGWCSTNKNNRYGCIIQRLAMENLTSKLTSYILNLSVTHTGLHWLHHSIAMFVFLHSATSHSTGFSSSPCMDGSMCVFEESVDIQTLTEQYNWQGAP